MKHITKKDVTVALLLSGRNGNSGPIYSVKEIMAKMLEVFPRSGTTENSIYYWASKTPSVSLSKTNTQVDLSAYARVMGIATETPEADEPEEKPETDSDVSDVDALREQIRLEIQAEIAESVRVEKEKRAAVRQAKLVKKADRVA